MKKKSMAKQQRGRLLSVAVLVLELVLVILMPRFFVHPLSSKEWPSLVNYIKSGLPEVPASG